MRTWSFGVVLAIALFAVPALAQRASPPPNDVERARELFAEGVRLIDEEQFAEAVARFRAVMPIRSTPQVKYNLALALRGTGELSEAAELFREVSTSRSAAEGLRDDARHMLRALERDVGHLTIRVAGDDDRAVVTLDGHAVGLDRLGYAIAVPPGDHEVVLRRGDETLSSEEVHVARGRSSEVTLRIAQPPAARAVALPAPQLDGDIGLPEERQQRAPEAPVVEQWWFWTALGAVGVVLVSIVAAVATSQ